MACRRRTGEWDTHRTDGHAQRAAHQRAERTHWSDDRREVREVRVQRFDAARRGTRYKDRDNAARAYISLVSRRILFGFRSIRPVFRRISPINPVFLGENWAADIAIIHDS